MNTINVVLTSGRRAHRVVGDGWHGETVQQLIALGRHKVGEEVDQGITRRDLLRRGAVLGGAVMWTTPVVQTLGMGRAFAQTASPVGKDISYMVITWTCGDDQFHTKLNEFGQEEAGATPDCEMTLEGSTPANLPPWVTSVGAASGACVIVTVDDDLLTGGCTRGDILLKAGSSQSTDDPCQSQSLKNGTHEYCTS